MTVPPQRAGGPADPVSADLFSTALISRYLDEPFIRRIWLAEQIEAHFGPSPCRLVLVTGAAGVGKSALAAWMTKRHDVSPRYFIRVDSRTRHRSGGITDLLTSLGRQLAALRPDLFADAQPLIEIETHIGEVAEGGGHVALRARRLIANPFKKTVAVRITQRVERVRGEVTGIDADEVVADAEMIVPEQLQQLALFDPARRLLELDPDARIVVIIDALDELNVPGSLDRTVADWLADCPTLPDNVRILVTSRPHAQLRTIALRHEGRLHEIRLDPGATEALRDVRSYADAVAGDTELAAALRLHGLNLRHAVHTAAGRAEGNFLFVVSWVRAIRNAVEDDNPASLRHLADFHTLPRDLDGLYELLLRLIRRRAEDRQWREVLYPLLATLSVSRAPLPTPRLLYWSGLTARRNEAREALHELRQLIVREPADDGGWHLIHASVAQFLTDPESDGDDDRWWYFVDPMVHNLRIADRILDSHGGNWTDCEDDYALAHVLGHLVSALVEGSTGASGGQGLARCARTLVAVVEDPGYADTRAARLGPLALLGDCLSAYRALTAVDPEMASRVARAVASHAARAEAQDVPGPLGADVLYAALAYRNDADEFYAAVLASAIDPDFLSAHVPGPRRPHVHVEFLRTEAGRLRRSGAVGEAEVLLADLADNDAATATQRSTALYDRGYAAYLRGEVGAAHELMLRSVRAAQQGGNEVSAWASRVLAAVFAYHGTWLSAADLERELREAAAFFEAVPRPPGSLAERFRMNCHGHLFELGVLEGDLELAEQEWHVLDTDPWVQQAQNPLWRQRWNARLALLRGGDEATAACEHYEAILGRGVLDAEEPPAREDVARDLLDFGRALSAAGRDADAVRAWRLVLRTADHTAAWLWKPRARRLLGEGG
ncbi:hypothetical protein [Kitasatospora camelliae]|uniref:AAA ATPase-like protein n=1 Tax=Kitasatospora camelliae TaxID=3156397 RepID=A0AAU8K622_9ACTN